VPISERTKEIWMNLQHILKQGALESVVGHKRKWQREKGSRHCNDYTEKVMNDVGKLSRNLYQQVK
jgi:hypothetical protein